MIARQKNDGSHGRLAWFSYVKLLVVVISTTHVNESDAARLTVKLCKGLSSLGKEYKWDTHVYGAHEGYTTTGRRCKWSM